MTVPAQRLYCFSWFLELFYIILLDLIVTETQSENDQPLAKYFESDIWTIIIDDFYYASIQFHENHPVYQNETDQNSEKSTLQYREAILGILMNHS